MIKGEPRGGGGQPQRPLENDHRPILTSSSKKKFLDQISGKKSSIQCKRSCLICPHKFQISKLQTLSYVNYKLSFCAQTDVLPTSSPSSPSGRACQDGEAFGKTCISFSFIFHLFGHFCNLNL